MLGRGDQIIEVLQYLSPPPEDKIARPCDLGFTHVALKVTDIRSAYQELANDGVTFNCAPWSIPSGKMAGWKVTYFQDPDGNCLELMQAPGEPCSPIESS